MSKKGALSGIWSSDKQAIECKLPIIIFEEDNSHIFYCPALDLSGYGETEGEASDSFEDVLSEYFKYTTNKGTLAKDLRRHGWIVRKSMKKKASPPPLSKLLQTNDDFSRIFNNHDFKKTETVVSLPAIA
ncbi:MAG: hypothetical protein ISS19_10330 [Bacteroidales bacterium]|nr:hypothetical protein [Bacteroidales bacterium]